MATRTETEEYQYTKTRNKTYYVCDADDCNNESPGLGAIPQKDEYTRINRITVNPETYRSFGTPTPKGLTKSNPRIRGDADIHLCDEHLNQAAELIQEKLDETETQQLEVAWDN